MGIYACPRCGNPNGWWSGNMRDVHDCPGPPRRQWPGQPPEFDWAELDEQPTNGVVVDRALNTTPVANQKPANLIDNADGVGTLARCAHHPSKCPHWEDCRARQECVGALGVPAVPASGPLRGLADGFRFPKDGAAAAAAAGVAAFAGTPGVEATYPTPCNAPMCSGEGSDCQCWERAQERKKNA